MSIRSDDISAIRSGSGLGASLDPSVVFYPDPYCPIVEAMPTACFEQSLLELFAENGVYEGVLEAKMEALTEQDVLNAINGKSFRYFIIMMLIPFIHIIRHKILNSKRFLVERDFSDYLHEIERNSTGHIISAKSTFMHWFGRSNSTAVKILQSKEQGMGMDSEPVSWLSENAVLAPSLNGPILYRWTQ